MTPTRNAVDAGGEGVDPSPIDLASPPNPLVPRRTSPPRSRGTTSNSTAGPTRGVLCQRTLEVPWRECPHRRVRTRAQTIRDGGAEPTLCGVETEQGLVSGTAEASAPEPFGDRQWPVEALHPKG